MSVAVVLLAAGRGERLAAGKPKALVEVNGQTLLEHSLSSVIAFDPDQVVLVAPASHLQECGEILARHGLTERVSIVAGGDSRQASSAAGLGVVTTEKVLIHDSARAFAPPSLFARVAAALSVENRSVVPALPVFDTIKQVAADRVVATPNRETLKRVQTPQGFFAADLRAAYQAATEDFTDDAGLLESRGIHSIVVLGDELAAKVTTPTDLDRVNSQFGAQNEPTLRSGIGSDAHRFGVDGVLQLGCLAWSELPQLEGHSDGDAMAHAIVDAMLSAAQLGDIGSNFGVDRPEFAAASGEVFLKGALELIRDAGFALVNVSVQVVADRPKIGPHREELQARLSQLLSAPVSVSATTTDGLGFLADARGVGCVATALLKRAG